MQLNQAMLCLIKSDMKQRMLFFFFPLKASKTPEKLPCIKFILELFGIKLPQCYASFDSLTLMRAEWLNLYVLHRNLGSWETHVSNPWKPSTPCISIALLALIQQGNGGTQELIKVMPQRGGGEVLAQLQQKQFTGTVKAVHLWPCLTNGCQDGNRYRNETFTQFRIITNFTGFKTEDAPDLTYKKHLKSHWRP